MKYFTKEVKIALTAIVAGVLLFLGINFMKGINIFKAENSYFVEFSNIKGLTVSSPVFADGYSIGLVRSIGYNYEHPGHVVVEFEVDKSMRIPKGSTATIDTELLGGANMTVLLANNLRERFAPGDTIKGDDSEGMMQKAATLVPKVEASLDKLDSILAALNALVADPALANILHNAEHITANLDQSTRQLNKLMATDVPQLTTKFNRIGTNMEGLTANMNVKLNQLDVEGTLSRVNTTLNNVDAATKKLNSTDNTVGLMLNDPSLYNNLNATANSANVLLEDLKGRPKRYVHFSIFGKKDKE